jgi:hypothetical protein
MEGITSRDKIDFSVMTDGEIFWYLQGKKQGHKEAKEDYEEIARERYEDHVRDVKPQEDYDYG